MITPTAREARIRSWLLTTFQSNGIERFSDLHIDRIDPEWRARKYWLKAGLTALHIAADQRTRHNLPVDIALVFSLKTGTDPVGINFRDAATLQEEFDWSPPSLYLLKKGEKPWSCGASKDSSARLEVMTKSIDSRLFDSGGLSVESYFMEFKPTDTIEYSRTVHLIG